MSMILFPHSTRLIYGFVAAVIIVNDEAFSIKPGTDCDTWFGHKIKKLSFLSAFVAYLGFLNVLVAHSHPVMLVFCHLLINRNSDRELKESLPQTESSGTSREENYRQGMSCFCHFFLRFVVSRMAIDPRNLEIWKDKPCCPKSRVTPLAWNAILQFLITRIGTGMKYQTPLYL